MHWVWPRVSRPIDAGGGALHGRLLGSRVDACLRPVGTLVIGASKAWSARERRIESKQHRARR
jgi:hypothetical protein